MLKAKLAGLLIRHGITALGAVMVANGTFDAETAASLTDAAQALAEQPMTLGNLSGFLITAGGLWLSYSEKRGKV